MTWTLFLSTLVFAAPAKKQLVGEHSAQTLRIGELMMGTSGIALGMLPRVQVSTRATLDVVGLPNGEVKMQLLDRPNMDVSVDAMLLGSTLSGLSATMWGAGANASLHRRRWTLHTGLHATSFEMSGVPTESPPIVVQFVGSDPLADLSSDLTDLLDVGVRYNTMTLRAGLEWRVWKRNGFLLQGSMNFGGRANVTAATTFEGTRVDVGNALPGVNVLRATTRPYGSWVTSLSWQQVIGPFHLRAGAGLSAVPYAWVTQAMSLSMRLGGWRLKRSHPAGVLADVEEETTDDAVAEVVEDFEDWTEVPEVYEPPPPGMWSVPVEVEPPMDIAPVP